MKTEEEDESLEVTADCEENVFGTPGLRWLQHSKSFFKKAKNFKFWGTHGSEQRVIALNGLSNFFAFSSNVFYDDDASFQVRQDIMGNLKNLLCQHRILPIPRTVRKKLVSAFESSSNPFAITEGHKIMSVVRELVQIRDDAIQKLEEKEWCAIGKFEEDSLHLRVLRKFVYDECERFEKTRLDRVSSNLEEYTFQVQRFLEEYEDVVSTREVNIWKNKLKETTRHATKCLGYVPVGMFSDLMECIEDDEEVAEQVARCKAEIAKVTQLRQLGSKEEVAVQRDVKVSQEAFDVIFEDSKVSETERQDISAFNLPSVPDDSLFEAELMADKELEILETRLSDLKQFRATWCSKPPQESEPSEKSPPQVDNTYKPKGNVKMGETCYKTSAQDTENFNSWYLDKISKKQDSHSKDAPKNNPDSLTSLSKPPSPRSVSFPSPTSVPTSVDPSMSSIQAAVVVTALTVIQILMNVTKHKLCQVPVDFPMPTTSFHPTQTPMARFPLSGLTRLGTMTRVRAGVRGMLGSLTQVWNGTVLQVRLGTFKLAKKVILLVTSQGGLEAKRDGSELNALDC